MNLLTILFRKEATLDRLKSCKTLASLKAASVITTQIITAWYKTKGHMVCINACVCVHLLMIELQIASKLAIQLGKRKKHYIIAL